MLSSKTVALAHRAHILTENALLIKLHQIAFSKIPDSAYNANWKLFKSCMKLLSKEVDVDLGIREMQAFRAILESTKIALQEKP